MFLKNIMKTIGMAMMEEEIIAFSQKDKNKLYACI